MTQEIIDLVNENDEVIGKTTRQEAHENELSHRVSAVLIFNNKGQIAIQKRAKTHRMGGLLDNSAAGHIISGQSYEDAAYKELNEELGIITNLKKIAHPLRSWYNNENGKNIKHIFTLFIGSHNGPFTIQESEVESVEFYDIDKVKEMMENNSDKFIGGFKVCFEAYLKWKNQNIKPNFPIFTNNPNLIYLDSAATSQRPNQVIEAITNFYEKENANIHRGIYSLSEEATQKYNEARKTTANFINANDNEIIFTKNTTESINLITNTIQPLIKKGKDEILLTEMEHHSNLVPWQQFAKTHNFKLKFIPITENYELDYEKAKELINEKTALLSFTYISNVFGTINNAKQLIDLAKEQGAITIIDAAQTPAHIKIDIKDLDTDFLAFSAHKLYGPLGIGILYGKKQLLDQLTPSQFGGGMINKVTYEDSTFIETPEKFEAGTQNISGAIGLAKAINFIQEIGLENIKEHEQELTTYTLEKLKEIPNLTIYSSSPEKNAGVISFTIKNIHPHDIAEILNDNNIAIRAGHHCCMPLMNLLNISGTCRISLAIFNTKEDIDKLIEALKKVQEVFR